MTRLDTLLALLGIEGSGLPVSAAAAARFRLKVPRPFIARMRPGDPHDPLLRQVLPLAAETGLEPGFVADPVGDGDARRAPGLIHKYAGRALLITSPACAVNCRYCFRRDYPYAEAASLRDLDPAIEHVRADPTLTEVILSGGDPLLRDDVDLAALIARLAAIPHVTRLRVHSRVPVVIPARVTETLISALSGTRLDPVLVIHCNHPNEVDPALVGSLRRLQRGGIPVLNQAVLLAGINDDAGALAALSERLFTGGVLPYYLHQLDPVAGAAHFEVGDAQARAIAAELAARLPGYLVPRLVREVPGAPAKVPLAPLPGGFGTACDGGPPAA